ncbi:murein biosynthesis integral membrane protein MurJ [Flavobacterium sp. ASW18X]|uniref:murein biosynthesis integral membrane protein MurJ n=1 Tax=Flavobacterium sp. ASW18X TaxID=2572595 RepID=UPI0010ADB84E|nr:lipid II flippase MurJ [Flavobacterium sp. ASW18X]TKD59113.1 virulence factor MviN [Flavobacterium sp. ASW18X]
MSSFIKRFVGILKALWLKSKGQLLSNMITVAIVTVIVKGVTFYKEIAIAEAYGISEVLDTFLIAILIPTFIQNVFINSYGSVFIPNYVSEKKDVLKAKRFQATSFIITSGITIVIIICTYLFIDYYLEILFPGNSNIYYSLIKKQLWIILPCIFLWGINSLIIGLLMVENEFLYSSLNAIFVPIVTVVLLLSCYSIFKELTLAYAMLIGSVFSSLYLIIVGFSKKIITIASPDFKSSNIKLLLKQIPAKMSSALIMGLTPIVDQYFSAQLATGAIAALNYGSKIPVVTLSLASVVIGNTLLPYFSKKAIDGNSQLYIYLKKILRTTFGAMSIVTIVLVIASKFIITLVFERGTFTATDTEQVYVIQQMYLLQLPFYLAAIIMNKYLTAINKNNFLVISSFVSLLLNIIFNYIFIKFFGIKGIALATALIYLSNSVLIFLYIIKINKRND